jgi:hypothetical protein
MIRRCMRSIQHETRTICLRAVCSGYHNPHSKWI